MTPPGFSAPSRNESGPGLDGSPLLCPAASFIRRQHVPCWPRTSSPPSPLFSPILRPADPFRRHGSRRASSGPCLQTFFVTFAPGTNRSSVPPYSHPTRPQTSAFPLSSSARFPDSEVHFLPLKLLPVFFSSRNFFRKILFSFFLLSLASYPSQLT